MKELINEFWEAVEKQDPKALADFFCNDAIIRWHDTNEEFDRSEFVKANCEYPGKWQCKIEKLIETMQCIITVTNVREIDIGIAFHAISFFQFEGDKIKMLEEYWGDIGEPPAWRIEMKIGRAIV